MNAEYRNSTHRAALERQAHGIRTVGNYGWFSPGRLAAEERLRTHMVKGEQARLLGLCGPHPFEWLLKLTRLREAAGSVLIRAGERLHPARAVPTERVTHGA